MARLAYKALYDEATRATYAVREQAQQLERALDTARGALAAFGRTVVERPEFRPGSMEPITLPSHEYVALEAMLLANSRYTVEEREIPAVASLMWRGHRVYCSPLVDPVLV